MNIIKLILISLFSINGLTLTNILVDRRSVIAGTIFSQTVNNYNIAKTKNIDNIKNIDYYAHWSVYGLVPPPIEKSITKEELVKEIDKNNIISL